MTVTDQGAKVKYREPRLGHIHSPLCHQLNHFLRSARIDRM